MICVLCQNNPFDIGMHRNSALLFIYKTSCKWNVLGIEGFYQVDTWLKNLRIIYHYMVADMENAWEFVSSIFNITVYNDYEFIAWMNTLYEYFHGDC